MNETITRFKKNRLWVIVVTVMFIWGLAGTGLGIFFHGKYSSLNAVISGAGGGELAEFIQQHGNTIISVYDDLNAVRRELEPALERAITAERLNERAYELAEQSNADITELRNTMASSGSTIAALIANQSSINAIVARIEANNTAVKNELSGGLGADN